MDRTEKVTESYIYHLVFVVYSNLFQSVIYLCVWENVEEFSCDKKLMVNWD